MKKILLVFLGVLSATTVFAAGNVKLYAPLQFPDGTTQSTATLQGPAGVAGPAGLQGPKGDPGLDAQITISAMCETITASGMEIPAFCTNPSKFSMEWLSGRTLYDVWYGMAYDANGNPKPGDYPGVARMIFGSNGIGQVKGLVNDEVDGSFTYNVSPEGRFYAETDDGSGFIIVGGGTSKYIKTYHLNAGGSFDNVDLFFYNEADARLYADGLSTSIPK